jgi:signal transduction histidine kinase
VNPKKRLFTISLVVGFCFLLNISGYAQKPFKVIYSDGIAITEGNVYSYTDSSNQENDLFVYHKFKQGLFRPVPQNILQVKNNNYTHWLALVIDNTTNLPATANIVLKDPFVDEITAYEIISSNPVQTTITGSLYPFDKRIRIDKNFCFPLRLNPLSSAIAMYKVKNNFHKTLLPIGVYTEQAYQRSLTLEYMGLGIYTGFFCLIAFAAILFYIFEKEKVYLSFLLYIFFALLWVWSNSGLGFQFIWPQYPVLMIKMRFISSLISISLLLWTGQLLIGKNEKNFYLYNAMYVSRLLLLVPAILLIIPFNLYYFNRIAIPFIDVANILLIGSILCFSLFLFQASRKGNKVVLFFFSSILVLLAGAICHILVKSKIIPINSITGNGNYIGLLFQISITIIGLAFHYNYVRKEGESLKISLIKEQEHAKLKAELAKEYEKKRIAADIHDEIGSSLSNLQLVGELALNKTDLVAAKKDIERITTVTKELNQKVRDVIWTLNSKNDYLEHLIFYIHAYGRQFFDDAEIRFIMPIPSNIQPILINSAHRKHLLLIVKEAFNNIVKHSEASLVECAINISSDKCVLSIHDDGKGFNMFHLNYGNGINNMVQRAKLIGGELHIETSHGTLLQLTYLFTTQTGS